MPSTERRRNGDKHDIKRTSDRKTATIVSVGGEGALRQHFLDMGIIPKAEITMVKYAPMGDPVEVRIHSYELTLRLADAEKITLKIYMKRNRFRQSRHQSLSIIPASEKAAGTTIKRKKTLCRKAPF